MSEEKQTLPPIFKWFEESGIAASGYPDGEVQLQAVADQGVKHIVALSSREPDTATISRLGMSVDRFTGASSELDALDAAVESVHRARTKEETCLVHWGSGYGGAGTVLAGYLVKYEGYSAADAVRKMREFRPDDLKGDKVDAFIAEFEKRLKNQ